MNTIYVTVGSFDHVQQQVLAARGIVFTKESMLLRLLLLLLLLIITLLKVWGDPS